MGFYPKFALSKTSCRGSTLLDLLIGVTLSLLVFGATVVTLNQGFTAFRLSQEKTKAQEASRIVLEKVAVYTRSASKPSTITDECGNTKDNKGKAIATTHSQGNKYGLFNSACSNSEIVTITRRNSSGALEDLVIQKDKKSLKINGNIIGYITEDMEYELGEGGAGAGNYGYLLMGVITGYNNTSVINSSAASSRLTSVKKPPLEFALTTDKSVVTKGEDQATLSVNPGKSFYEKVGIYYEGGTRCTSTACNPDNHYNVSSNYDVIYDPAAANDSADTYSFYAVGINKNGVVVIKSNVETITVKSKAIDGECGSNENSCVSGDFEDLPDSSTEYKWRCKGGGGGIDKECPLLKPIPPPQCGRFNGQNFSSLPADSRYVTCGGSDNNATKCLCSEGTPSIVGAGGTSGVTAYFWWTCENSKGEGKRCRTYKPEPINGECGTTTKYTCVDGNVGNKYENLSYYTWDCEGINDGRTVNCAKIKITDGKCGASVNTCDSGNWRDYTDTQTEIKWQCVGINGGKDIKCDKPKPTYECSETACQGGEKQQTFIKRSTVSETDACEQAQKAASEIICDVAGACAVNNQNFTAAEVQNWSTGKTSQEISSALCSSGTLSSSTLKYTETAIEDTVDSTCSTMGGKWEWSCQGSNGGSTVPCSATKQQYTATTYDCADTPHTFAEEIRDLMPKTVPMMKQG